MSEDRLQSWSFPKMEKDQTRLDFKTLPVIVSVDVRGWGWGGGGNDTVVIVLVWACHHHWCEGEGGVVVFHGAIVVVVVTGVDTLVSSLFLILI